jgi:4'-phosphopantetheinyl transferase
VNAALAIDPGAAVVPFELDLRLWLIDLDVQPVAAESLPEAVRLRAARFVRDTDRRRYLASQTALRHLLGAAGPWTTGAHGKPALGRPPPHFNLGRRDGWAVIAVSGTHEVGVDIETQRPIDDAQELAAMHFTPHEREGVALAVGAERDHTFLRVWTRKEACMKATGLGLALAPSSFECGVDAVAERVRIATPQHTWALLVHTPGVDAPVVVSWAVVRA